MVKIDFNQDYYADLEVGPSAGIEDIRRSYRKLALKYHPDRNPGSEIAAGQKFQTIQAAYEVLTNAEQKQRYDISRRTRYGGASGVKGNPYQDISKNYPPPPRPPGFAPRTAPKRAPAPSAADTYAKFAKDVPPTVPRASRKPAESTFTWQAWEQMRSGAKGKTTGSQTAGSGASAKAPSASKPASTAPPPVPPRSPQKQAKGSFGNRVNRGYTPHSPSGDEPPVASNNYFTTRTRENPFSETSGDEPPVVSNNYSTTRTREKPFIETSGDEPPVVSNNYSTRTRENLFSEASGDEPPVANNNYSTRTRENLFSEAQGDEPPVVSNNYSTTRTREKPFSETTGDEPPVVSNNYFTTRTREDPFFSETSTAARARQRDSPTPSPPDPDPSTPDPTADFRDSTYVDTRQKTPYRTPAGEKLDPSLGANVNRSRSTRESTRGLYRDEEDDSPSTKSHQRSASAPGDPELSPEGPPEGKQAGKGAFTGGNDEAAAQNGSNSAFESQDRAQERNPDAGGHSTMPNAQGANAFGGTGPKDRDNSRFFDFQYAEHSFTPDPHKFTRNSADNINTRFVADESDATNWQFSAGSPISEDGRPALPRSKSGSRIGRKPPFQAQASQAPFVEPTNGNAPPPNSSFNPEEWSEKIGPQIFQAPGQTQKGNTIRPIRNPSKKPKPVRMTAGTAGMVESDENSSGQEDISLKSPATADTNDLNGHASPNAMDIDNPLEVNGVRNIHVEPSRPEWRAGDVKGMKADAMPAADPPTGAVPPVGGSEDSEEFRTTFSDLRNVEPFAQPATGLESFGDIKSNLPFPSSASGHVPIQKGSSKPVKLDLPEAPKPPSAPPTLAVQGLKPSAAAWTKYVGNFYGYLTEWHAYNTKFSDHFQARTVEVQKKLADPGWVESRDGAGVQEYLRWAEEDRQVRAKWTEASHSHEMNVRVFVAHRDKMMK